ncbi:hypothetical protein Ciccas_005170 [Cichlidogyrus casuarinus]|uniref:Centriolin n=1 Tax=Cichlidogyrus casuarinus TaxID=1844966 RepID=A0ABD2Q9D8_9PLAT
MSYQNREQEVEKLKINLDDAQAKANIAQKRIEERELRLKKIEQENNSLLDEIHALRKKNQETESQIDCLRQRLIDRNDTDSFEMRNDGSESDKLRAKNSELFSENAQLQRSLNDTQIQLDRLSLERENLKEDTTRMQEQVVRLNENLCDARSCLSQLQSSKQLFDVGVQSLTETSMEETMAALEFSAQQSQQDKVVIAELRGALQQALLERDQIKEQAGTIMAASDFSQLETQQQFYSNQSSLQHQVIQMQQAQREVAAEMDRIRRDSSKATIRVQDLTRQLQETQKNCDSIAKQRDELQEQLSQYQRTYDALGITLGGSGGAPGLMKKVMTSTGSTVPAGGISHLSRELDRLHRDHEQAIIKLEETEVQSRTYRAEYEGARNELKKARDELGRLKDHLKELQEQTEAREDEMSKLQRLEAERCRDQVQEVANQLAQTHHQLQNKDAQLERLIADLEKSQRTISDLELDLRQLKQMEQQFSTKTELDENERQRHRYETETLRKEVELRENQASLRIKIKVYFHCTTRK